MNNPEHIKELISPTMVAKHYLGQPVRVTGNKLWYKSPFRNERTASFFADDKSLHDFGESWDGDIFNFIERYYNTDFITAVKILGKDFGLPEDKEISKELEQYIKRQREEEIQMKKTLNDWFNNTYIKLCKELHKWNKIIPHVKQEALKIAYKKQVYLEYLIELFLETKEEEKIELWRDKIEIEKQFE